MLEIKPVEDKKKQEEICRECGAVFKEGAFAYSASENGKVLGVCQFGIVGEYGYVYDLKNAVGVDDFEALFLMGRAVLNFIDLCGTHKAIFTGDESAATKAVGFKNENGRLFMDLEGFFSNPCGHEK
ncbi:MAG: hypothetical protein J5832_04525 [Clostridia bacterium]|nr:hypothetical protein [Clostridia bacterium]